jgi:Holliday junction DNA helicase RuvA
MIGKISGIVDYIADDHVLIEAGGIGYLVHCAPGTLAALPAPGEAASLYTELVVREDLLQLLGFRTVAEREWHRLLTTVQGVGAKASLAILGVLGAEGVSRAIALGDTAAIRRAPGVGPKLAARIVNELADKAPDIMALGAKAGRSALPRTPVAVPATVGGDGRRTAPSAAAVAADVGEHDAATADALSALLNLGYERLEAARAIAEAARSLEPAITGGPVEDGGRRPADAAALIRAALRALGTAM